ncbi:type II toxin-antitoxin system YafQ family toxin [Sulfurimonas sp. SAG-AH-194-C21]|nr:type II toxin-antitoxin system YafQ family toxin [Sulfurimonas sp. SAG-AH-194-C21]MDF1883578.1 type II toxin-antitoxin system YafQ family toxin [Sulfurimonas sp. SAG-AH-194-C21]
MIKYRLFKTNSFKRAYKRQRLSDEEDLAYIDVVYNLLCGNELIQKYKDHQLIGKLKDFRECHIKPDLLLIYIIEDNTLKLVDIGSHSELFD